MSSSVFKTAAWLRAESHWEDRPNDRYTESYKRKFADQEFNSIKRRCKGQQFQKCSCIVAVKIEEKNVKQTVLKSVVGTLDLSIRHLLLQGESFPRVISNSRVLYLHNILNALFKIECDDPFQNFYDVLDHEVIGEVVDPEEREKGKYMLIRDVEDYQQGLYDKPLMCFGCGIGWFS
ncbi:hypothetical protein GIB67_001544 [Kingdonia uniflora]|uniref:Uncharacterized protein n=1 Tax=Kingdonia uniflora TaxID=39325 RepID=A0A7J7NR71_9MAGN|nr:hypothetical protein GIB67_001544 [Kingdonia uniflora]